MMTRKLWHSSLSVDKGKCVNYVDDNDIDIDEDDNRDDDDDDSDDDDDDSDDSNNDDKQRENAVILIQGLQEKNGGKEGKLLS